MARAPGASDDPEFEVLAALVTGQANHGFELDAIVLPKVETADEVWRAREVLAAAGARAAVRVPRVVLLAESARCLACIGAIVAAGGEDLAGIVFGPVDYAADLAIASQQPSHPVLEWARASVVNAAAAGGVPSLDGMTIAFPLHDPALDMESNKRNFLDRMLLIFEAGMHARRLGMLGKWVGHPAQLFAMALVQRATLTAEQIEQDVANIRAYQTLASAGQAVGVVNADMADRATDRVARSSLREAIACGLLDETTIHDLGLEEFEAEPKDTNR